MYLYICKHNLHIYISIQKQVETHVSEELLKGMEECVLFYFTKLDFGNFTLTCIILQFAKDFLSLYGSNVKVNDNIP